MKKEKYVIAVKDVSSGEIRPGRILASYRKFEFANRDFQQVAARAGYVSDCWRCGVFFRNKCLR